MGSCTLQRSGELAPLQRLSSFALLSADDADMIAAACRSTRDHRIGSELSRKDGDPAGPLFLVSGWAGLVRLLTNGKRQILAYYLPGDLIGHAVTPGKRETVVALTRAQTADAGPLLQMAYQGRPDHSGLLSAIEQSGRLEQIHILNQISRLGCQSAVERFANLLLEFERRLTRSGQCKGGEYSMPLTQDVLGECLGLSTVHINRTLQTLKREGMIRAIGATVTILDRKRLRELGDYMDEEPSSFDRKSDVSGRGVDELATAELAPADLTVRKNRTAQNAPNEMR